MTDVKDQTRALLDQIKEDAAVLEQVKQLLEHAIGGEGEAGIRFLFCLFNQCWPA